MTLKRSLSVHPQSFGPNLREIVVNRLLKEVEGTCSDRTGFIVSVVEVLDSGMGRIVDNHSGFAVFPVTYKAVVFRPYKNEVFDGTVSHVNKMGFFVKIGPLRAFVSKHMMPDDVVFDLEANPPAFSSEGSSLHIAPGTDVRVKIVGIRFDASDIFAVATIKEDYLGPL